MGTFDAQDGSGMVIPLELFPADDLLCIAFICRYLTRTPDAVANEIVIYADGYAGFTHRDVLRLAHPNPLKNHAMNWKKAKNLVYCYDLIYCWACTGWSSVTSMIFYPNAAVFTCFREN